LFPGVATASPSSDSFVAPLSSLEIQQARNFFLSQLASNAPKRAVSWPKALWISAGGHFGVILLLLLASHLGWLTPLQVAGSAGAGTLHEVSLVPLSSLRPQPKKPSPQPQQAHQSSSRTHPPKPVSDTVAKVRPAIAMPQPDPPEADAVLPSEPASYAVSPAEPSIPPNAVAETASPLSPATVAAGTAQGPGSGTGEGTGENGAVGQTTDFSPYIQELRAVLGRHWRPKAGHSVRVVVLMEIAHDGQLLNVQLQDSSGDPDVDASALAAVQRAAPFQPLPEGYTDNSVPVLFTFDYTIRNRFRD
jgi:TonB family protein